VTIVPGTTLNGVHDISGVPAHALKCVATVELVILAFVGVGGGIAGEERSRSEDDSCDLHFNDLML
jgi:hypothetical protein